MEGLVCVADFGPHRRNWLCDWALTCTSVRWEMCLGLARTTKYAELSHSRFWKPMSKLWSEEVQLVSFFLSGSLVKNLENALGKWQTGYSTGNYVSARLQKYIGTSFIRWWYSSMSTNHQLLCSTASLFFWGKKTNNNNSKKKKKLETFLSSRAVSWSACSNFISWENCWCRWLFWKYVQYISNIYISSPSPLMCNIVSCLGVSLAYRHWILKNVLHPAKTIRF